jgi:hypothetical protein
MPKTEAAPPDKPLAAQLIFMAGIFKAPPLLGRFFDACMRLWQMYKYKFKLVILLY